MTMIHDFVYVRVPKETVCRRLDARSGAWLGPFAAGALDDGERLLVRLGPFTAGGTWGKTVEVTTGPPVERGEVTLIPISWRATGTPHLFPVMAADLEIAPLGAELTQVTMQGQYEPPLGVAGRGLDRLVLHRIAHATVRSFLHRLLAGLTAAEVTGQPATEQWRPMLAFPADALAEE